VALGFAAVKGGGQAGGFGAEVTGLNGDGLLSNEKAGSPA
jgi:hypothetical protein